MKAVLLMFDSLTMRHLSCYGRADGVKTPNFDRLAARSTVCDHAYVGSMPCMPARREIHTGRYNFLHRAWGPLEPFDDSMPELLKKAGVHTHLVSDHHHYWEDGGATYHPRYNTWEIVRGQEYDRWKGEVAAPKLPERIGKCDPYTTPDWIYQHFINRKYMPHEEDHPLVKTFALGEQFVRANADNENWFLQLENFCPHEPFVAADRYRKQFGLLDDGPDVSWPRYGAVEPEDQLDRLQREYDALLVMCDDYLGRFLNTMDELNLWDDTLLIVTTDHGLLLGEKNWLGKCKMPFYNEIARIPFFVWDPRDGKCGERSDALIQMIDVAPTILEAFGLPAPKDMQGINLPDLLSGTKTRETCLFGSFGGHINCTDGKTVYMRAPDLDAELYNYTLMPMHTRSFFPTAELAQAEMVPPLSFTKGCPVLKVPAKPFAVNLDNRTLLFDLESDPEQLQSLNDSALEQKMAACMVRLMKEHEAPDELYTRMRF